MASDGFPTDATTVGVLASLAGAVLAWLGARLVGKAALENALTATAKELLEQLRTELRMALRERDTARADNVELRSRIEEMERTIDALELRVAGSFLPRRPA